MRYEDASHSGSFQDQGPIARDDADQLAAGERGPATGNVISGAGTETGASGADAAAAGARVIAVAGAGGNDSSFEGGRLRVEGEHGTLSLTAKGDYSYTAKAGVPENSRDTFTYTLSDASGATSKARLEIEIGKTQAVVKADAQRIVPGPDGVVVLPAGVELSDIRIVGRDLLIMLPDGSQMLIVDGAVFVPQLVINDIEVPSTNLAALLIDQEPRPASGVPQSSGGNFIEAVGPLDPGTPLGDLLPPTQLDYTPPEFRDTALVEDRQPVVGPNAIVQIDDDARPGGNAGGTGDDPDSVNASGTLSGSGGDGQLTFAFNATGAPVGFTYAVNAQGALVVSQNGVAVLTVTLNAQTGAYVVTQNAPIVHAAGENENNVVFTFNYTVTDQDGDSAAGTLQVNVDDDTPIIDAVAGADAAVTLTTDDADSRGDATDTASSSANFSGVFSLTQSAGADLRSGPAGVLAYSLGTPGGPSGLTQGGVAINLYLIGGKVVGSTATSAGAVTSGNTVFDVAVGSGGVVTLTQYSQIDHVGTDPSPTGAPFNDQIASLADNLVTLSASATLSDRDGDTASDSATIQIGANLRFTDDGPSLSGVQAGAGVALDETAAGSPAGFPINATSAAAIISASAIFGADGPAATGATTYALTVNGTGATSLRTAIGDFPITLAQSSASVITGTYVEGGVTKVAFTATINANGTVSVVQNVPLEHLNDGSTAAAYNDSLSLSGLVNATITLRDSDGDTATATVPVGDRITFLDDGPSITVSRSDDSAILLQVDDADTIGAAFDTASANFAPLFTFNGNGGADGAAGPVAITYSLAFGAPMSSTGLTAGGLPILLVLQNGKVYGTTATSAVGMTPANTVFEVSIDSATGVVTVTQFSQLDHPVGSDPSQGGAPFSDQFVSLPDGAINVWAQGTIVDNDGDTAEILGIAPIGSNIRFTDDGPVALADSDALAAGTYGPETGNVITGEGTISGAAGADRSGADSPARVVAIEGAGGQDSSFDEAGNLVIAGQYGTLTIKADGSYSYARNQGTPGGVSDVFTYTLRDSDGDTSKATLTIAIGNLPPTLDAPDADAPGTIVYEAGLSGSRGPNESEGSGEEAAPGANGDTRETTSGTITFTQGDGPATVRIDGVAVTAVDQVIDTGEGLLRITSIGNGSIGYEYTLKDNLIGNQGVNGGDRTDTISVTITDQDNQVASDTLVVVIKDDAPTARSDEQSIDSDVQAFGNVITGQNNDAGINGVDTKGADNALVIGGNSQNLNSGFVTGPVNGFVTITGQYGSLQLFADGNYIYTRNDDAPLTAVEKFTYLLRDSDGDISGATLTLNINDRGVIVEVPVAGSATTIVYEAALGGRGGEPEGSGEEAAPGANGDTREAVSGFIDIVAPDGIESVLIAGTSITQAGNQVVFQDATGRLEVTTVEYDEATGVARIGYTYTLLDNTLGAQPPASGDVTIPFSVVVTDEDGDSASGSLVITIRDDAPDAKNDVDAMASGSYGPELGNVITGAGTSSGATGKDVVGADNGVVVAVTGFNGSADDSFDPQGNLVVNGQYGILTIKADGSYSYVRNPGSPGGVSDVFSYTLRDADGDQDTATLTINIGNNTPTIDAPNADAPGTIVDEKGLSGGRGPNESEGSGEEAAPGANGDTSETTVGTILISQGDGPSVVTINGVVVQPFNPLNPQVIDTGKGLLTITGYSATAVTYSYTLKDNSLVNGTDSDIIQVAITDQDGSTASDTLTIRIIDDAPIARNDADTIAAGTFGPESGNVISGAGTNNPVTGKDTLGADGAVVVGIKAGVDSAAIETGVGTVINGQYGTLTLNADGSYTYNRAANTPGGVTDSFSYTLKDADGDTSVARLDIIIQDSSVEIDIPPAGGATTTVYEAGLGLRPNEPAGSGEIADGDAGNNSDPSEAVSGNIGFVAKDGLGAISLGGVTLDLAGTYPQTITTANGQVLVVNGVTYNAATGLGSISYTYTLTDNRFGNQAVNDGDTSASFAVVVTDKDGDVSPAGNLVITIKDDAPIARNDTDSIGNRVGPEGGNVINGAGTTSGAAGADTVGADGAIVVAVNSVNNNSLFNSTPVNSAYTIQGQYGVLTISQNGNYNYVRDNGAPLTGNDVFTYVLRDTDGDVRTATLTINIVDNPVTSDIPAAGSASTLVYEAGLGARGGEPEGSGEEAAAGANGDAREAVTGVISFSGADGIDTVSLGGTQLTGTVPQVLFSNAVGTLEVIAITYDEATGAGSITYRYTLADNTLGANPPASGNTTQTFALVVTDDDGDTSGGNLVITIVDDAPTARLDTDSVVEGASTIGNVILGTGTDSGLAGKDTVGADGAVVIGVKTGGDTSTAANANVGTQINGAYGKLTLNADGSYTYVANPNSVTAGQQDVFTYTIRDADGDLSTTTLTITVNNVTLTPDTEVNSVNEAALDLVQDPADLAAGTATGSNPGSGAETVTGQLSVAGATSYVLNGSANGANGILQLNSDGTYKYTLTTPLSTVPNANDGAVVSGSNVFTYTATDANGNSVQGTITINIVDDVPTARVDNDTVAAGSFAAEGGNVITGAGTTGGTGGVGADTRGADGATVVGIKAGTDNGAITTGVGAVIQGQYGKLTIAADGTYSYTRDQNTPGDRTDTFSYTLRDGDGDTSVTQLNIYIQDSPVTIDIPPAGGATTTVYEAALGARGPGESQGSIEGAAGGANDDPREAVSGNIGFVSKDGLGGISLNGVAINLGGSFPQTVVNEAGQTLVVTGISYNAATGIGSIAYTYTLLDNTIGNQAVANGDTQASFAVVVTDKDGDVNPAGNLVITIKDDAPTANNDAYEILEGDSDNAITFDVDLNDVPGADNTGSRDFTTLTGTYGTLTLNADGTQTYTLSAAGQLAINALAPNATLTDNFSYTLTDGDGDSDPTTVVVTLRGTDDPPVISDLTPKANGGDAVVDEDDLPAGSDTTKESLTTTGDFKISAPDGVDDLTVGGVAVIVNGVFQANASGTTPLGNTITFTGYNAATGVVSYSYTLLANEAHPNAAGENNLFDDLAVTLTDSDQDVASDTLSIRIIDDVPTANDDLGYEIFEGDADNAITFDVDLNDVPGADGTASRTFTSLTGTYGTLTLNADGTQTYTLSVAGKAAIDALAPGATLTDNFSYTLTDGDGDSDPANVVVTLRGTDDPPVISDLTPALQGGDASVDEDDLPNGSDTSKESLTGTGNFKIAAPDGIDDLTVGGIAVIVNGVFQVGASGTTPLGNTITFTGYDAATGVVSYGYTLLANEAHASANGENNLFDNLTVTLTDSDQDVATDTLSIRIVDDVPTAVNETVGQIAENQTVIIDALANDIFGADGVDTDNNPNVRVSVITQPPAGQGSVVYDPVTGKFVFTPASGQEGSTSFSYQIVDGDGDVSTATVTINLQPDSVPIVTNAVAKVDDDALAGGNPGGTGDIDANSGEVPASASEAVFNGKINVNWGNDASGSSITFANLNGQPGTVGTEAVTYSWSGNVLTATSARGAIFTVTVNAATGDYTVNLLKPILHAAGGNETSAFVDLNYRAQDGDGDVLTTGKLTIEFNDDAPNPFTPGSVTTTNGDTPAVQGQLNLSIGADGFGTIVFDTAINGTIAKDPDGRTLSIGNQPLIYEVNGSQLIAKTAGGVVGYVVNLNQNGTYTFDVQNVISNGTETSFTDLSGARAGNTSYVGIGSNDTGTAIDILLSGTNAQGNNSTVNTDSDSIGVANQSMNNNEVLRIDFVSNLVTGTAANPSGFTYGAHVGTTNFTQTIPQVQASQGQTVSLQIWALDTTNVSTARPDSTPDNGFSDATKIGVVTVRAIDGATSTSAEVTLTTVGQSVAVGNFGVTAILQADGSVIFNGLQQGDQYGIGTGNTQFEAVVVKALGDFDLGIFRIGSFNAGTPIVQVLPVIATDADGDSVSSTLTATINPVGSSSSSSSTLAATSSSMTMTSSSPNPTYTITDGNKFKADLQSQIANSNIALVAGLAAGVGAPAAAEPAFDTSNKETLTGDITMGSNLIARDELGGLDAVDLGGGLLPQGDLGGAAGNPSLGSEPIQTFGNEHGLIDVVDPAAVFADAGFTSDLGTSLALPAAPVAQPALLMAGGEILLPSAEQMMALTGPGLEPVQRNPGLEDVLSDALAGGGGDAIGIDHLIDAAVKLAEQAPQLPGQEIADLAGGAGGGDAGLLHLATQLSTSVPGWDAGHFSALFQTAMPAMDAPTLHPDAVQPVANG